MSDRDRKRLKEIHTFPALVKYLREDLGWPVEQESFDDLDDITFDWEADELGIDPEQAAKIEYIKQLRPLENGQPQGVFFVKFNAKTLPVVALRRLLGKLVVKKRATANAAERPLWAMRDLVFISSYGASGERQLSFAYFQEPELKTELPTLKVLGWDDRDTALQLDRVHDQLTAHLTWPATAKALPAWRKGWSAAFELRHGEIVTTAKELAEQLAALARGIRERANQLLRLETEKGPLRTLMAGFKTALIHDLTEDQFADMYAQTIAYGLLSARITHPDPVKAETLPDLIPVTNPFLKELMETFVLAGGKHRGRKRGLHLDFDELGINDVVELLRRANMDAVLRNFGANDRKEDPVTYFYEDFLNAYDAKERKRRGVYYTPKPVVSYIVRSVHELLKSEFAIEDGLASTITWGEMIERHKDLRLAAGATVDSPFVKILDPATGTATFLVEAINVVLETLKARWKKRGLSEAKQIDAWNEYVPKHLLPRLCGYELMMAPYAIAHLKIGLKLFETGYRFDTDERAHIYLTNALEPASDASNSQIDALSEALAHEARAVNLVKREYQFTVVVGNPPYSNYGQLNRNPFILGLLEDYKRGLDERKLNLDDDFIKFVRFAQWCVNRARLGVLGFITNNIYLDGTTHRQMRHHLAETFGNLRVVDLCGDGRKQLKGVGGVRDENVFDIMQGVALSIFTIPPARKGPAAQVDTKRLIGLRSGLPGGKYEWLADHSTATTDWTRVELRPPNYFFVKKDLTFEDEYLSAPSISEIFMIMWSGIQTKRDSLTVDWNAEDAWTKVTRAARMTPAELRQEFQLPEDGRDWKAELAIRDLRQSGPEKRRIIEFAYRPLDRRFVYYTGQTKGWIAYPRREASDHLLNAPNAALMVKRSRMINVDYFCHVCVVDTPPDINYLADQSYFMPLYSAVNPGESLFGQAHGRSGRYARTHNVSPRIVRELADAQRLRFVEDGVGDLKATFGPDNIFHYAYAVLHSPGYRSRYATFLKTDFPRIPFPGGLQIFHDLAKHGNELVALHLMKSPNLRNVETTYMGPKHPEVIRVGWSHNTVWLDAEVTKKEHGAITGRIGFNGVPESVWNFHIGGYQVCEKWLKDRRGRKLSDDDIEHYQKIVVTISETIRIMGQIDETIEQLGGWPHAFQMSPVAPAK